jgi:hypothetical protein
MVKFSTGFPTGNSVDFARSLTPLMWAWYIESRQSSFETIIHLFPSRNVVTKIVLLEFDASTNTIEENEKRFASENNLYLLGFNLVVGRTLSGQKRIAGWCAAAR